MDHKEDERTRGQWTGFNTHVFLQTPFMSRRYSAGDDSLTSTGGKEPVVDWTKFNLQSADPDLPGNALNKMLHEVFMKGHVERAEWERDEFGQPKTLIVYYDYLYPEKDEDNG